MFPPSEPELCVAAHAGGGRVVRHPEGRPRLRVLQRLPGDLAGSGVHPRPPVHHDVLRLLQDLLWPQAGLCQRQSGHVKVSSEGVELCLVGGEYLHHPPLDLVLVGHQPVRVQGALTGINPPRQLQQLREDGLGPHLQPGPGLGQVRHLRYQGVCGPLYQTSSVHCRLHLFPRIGRALLGGAGGLL